MTPRVLRKSPAQSSGIADFRATPETAAKAHNALKGPRGMVPCVLAIFGMLLWGATFSARANVYATNIKINGGFTNVSVAAGTNVSISYILNEPASAGVVVRVIASNAVVRAISISAGSPGTLRGTNTVIWDGKDNGGLAVAAGAYAIAIMAASHGYSVWTQITDETNAANAVWQGRGIAVDQNTNSPYYGRVFVANSVSNPQGPPDFLGYQVGILKCNADASYADEGGLSTGGYPWPDDGNSPWHLEVSSADRIYADDATTNGQVISWDATIAPNSELLVLRPDNWTNLNVSLSGLAISGTGTNQVLWMSDATFTTGSQTGVGILKYALRPDGTCAVGDKGLPAVAVGGSLTGNPFDVALDSAGNIYTIYNTTDLGDPNNRVFRFPPYPGPTNGTGPKTVADWAVGAHDDTMAGASGIAVDPTGTYVAVAFAGLFTEATNGCTQILYATNGAVVTNLDLGVIIGGSIDHEDEDVAWDAIGNVYYIDNWIGVWRAVSPPGTNQATTVALPAVQVTGSTPPPPPSGPIKITQLTISGGRVNIDFTAGTNDTASAFGVVGAASVTGPYSNITGAVITKTGPGLFHATFALGPTTEYFRITGPGTTPPPNQLSFTSIAANGPNMVLTFTGNTTDSASAFKLLSAATVNGSFTPASNAVISQISPGLLQASVPASGPAQFYRIAK